VAGAESAAAASSTARARSDRAAIALLLLALRLGALLALDEPLGGALGGAETARVRRLLVLLRQARARPDAAPSATVCSTTL
jgi:hypothetical protein